MPGFFGGVLGFALVRALGIGTCRLVSDAFFMAHTPYSPHQGGVLVWASTVFSVYLLSRASAAFQRSPTAAWAMDCATAFLVKPATPQKNALVANLSPPDSL